MAVPTTNRHPTRLQNLHPRQPISCHKLPKTYALVSKTNNPTTDKLKRFV